MELLAEYEQYKDEDPSLKNVRAFVNKNLSKYGIAFNSAKPLVL